MLSAARREDSRAPALLARDPDLLAHETFGSSCAFNSRRRQPDRRRRRRRGLGRGHQGLRRDGRIDRDRLLDALLDALASDLSAYRSTWYTRLWRDLKPTPDERTARTDAPARAARRRRRADRRLRRRGARPYQAAPRGPGARARPRADRAGQEDRARGTETARPHESPDRAHCDARARATRPRTSRTRCSTGWSTGARRAPPATSLLRRHRGDLLAASRPARAPRRCSARDEPSERRSGRPRSTAVRDPRAIRASAALRRPVPAGAHPRRAGPGRAARIQPLDELAVALGSAAERRWDSRDERLVDAILRRCDEPMDAPRAYADQLYHVWWISVARSRLADRGPRAERPSAREPPSSDRAPGRRGRPRRQRHRRATARAPHPRGRLDRAGRAGRAPARSRRGRRRARADPGAAAARPRGRATKRSRAASDLPGRPGELLRCALGGPAVEADDSPPSPRAASVGRRSTPRRSRHCARRGRQDRVEFTAHGPHGSPPLPTLYDAAARQSTSSTRRVARAAATSRAPWRSARVAWSLELHAGRRPGRPAAAGAAARTPRAAAAARAPAADRWRCARQDDRGPPARRRRR